MAAMAIAWVALPALGIRQFLHAQDLGDLDHASYAHALWNFRHGILDYSFQGMNILGIHSQYASILWIPLHLAAGELGLKIGEGLCLMAAAILVFRGQAGDSKARSWGMAALLASPPIASQFFFGFHPEFIGAPLLILAIRAYRDERYRWFLAYCLILPFCKEVFALAIAGILLLAMAERRPWRWVVAPALLCCFQMAVYWFVVVPRFAPSGNFLHIYFPESFGQVLGLWFSLGTLSYLSRLVLPFLPLMLVLPWRYCLLPLPLAVFYASFPDPLFRVIWPNYAFLPGLLCAAGLVLEHGRGPWLNPYRTRLYAAFAAASLLCYPLWREVITPPGGGSGRNADIASIKGLVPEEASLLINAGFTARFAARREVALWGERSVWGPRTRGPEHFDYVLIDGRFKPGWLVDPQDLARGIESLSRSPLWIRVYEDDSLYLFRRLRVPDPTDEAREKKHLQADPDRRLSSATGSTRE
ncbi:MAG: hypothetical protein JWP91_2586 [Fibrobacteres bacterium]|nr:hypothetical protein [Fibrobacterota bacterium]